jgi:hypothetical protein
VVVSAPGYQGSIVIPVGVPHAQGAVVGA